MKKIVLVILALVMIFALASCNGDVKPVTSGTDSAAESTGSVESAEEVTVMTYAEFAAAEVDTEVTVETYVQAKQGWW